MDNVALGIAWYIVFIVSITVHEFAHAFCAMKLGDKTAYHGGQVSLDPIPHIQREPVGTIIVPIISFAMSGWMMGWASAPYDPLWADRNPRRAAYMGLAGPASNLLLVIVAAILIHIGIAAGIFHAPDSIAFTEVAASTSDGPMTVLAVLISLLFSLNLLLCIFNLIPLPPLDGTSILHFLLDENTYAKYQNALRNPGLSILGIVIAWKTIGFIYGPVHTIAIELLYPGMYQQY